MRLTLIGGPTVLVEAAGWRILTDPTFDPPGGTYHFGWGTGSVKLAGPAIPASELGPLDAILLTHDHHDDNLDPARRAFLPTAGTVVTTAAGAKRLGGETRGLEPWETTALEAPGKPSVVVDVDGSSDGALWFSGDTVMYGGVRQVPDRVKVDVALLHLGGVQFPVTGPLRYTMTAEDAIELCRLLEPRVAVPIHYEGWKHFKEGREAVEVELADAPEEIRRRFRWLPLGEGVELDG